MGNRGSRVMGNGISEGEVMVGIDAILAWWRVQGSGL